MPKTLSIPTSDAPVIDADGAYLLNLADANHRQKSLMDCEPLPRLTAEQEEDVAVNAEFWQTAAATFTLCSNLCLLAAAGMIVHVLSGVLGRMVA